MKNLEVSEMWKKQNREWVWCTKIIMHNIESKMNELEKSNNFAIEKATIAHTQGL